MTPSRFSRTLSFLIAPLWLAGCAVTQAPNATQPSDQKPSITYVKHERRRLSQSLTPCITGRRFDVMLDQGGAIDRDDVTEWLSNMMESLPRDKELPIFVMTARPFSIPAGVENPQPAAIGRLFANLPTQSATEPLQRAIQEYRRTYLCERQARGTLMIFSNLRGLAQRINHQGIRTQIQRLLTENHNVHVVWIVANAQKTDFDFVKTMQEDLPTRLQKRHSIYSTRSWRDGQIDSDLISILLGYGTQNRNETRS